MEESILNFIKTKLGYSTGCKDYDVEIVDDINAAFSVLSQLGLGPNTGFYISGENETWSDILGDRKDLELVKTYVWIKTRLLFDPPQSSTYLKILTEMASEYEWRINTAVELGPAS